MSIFPDWIGVSLGPCEEITEIPIYVETIGLEYIDDAIDFQLDNGSFVFELVDDIIEMEIC